MMPFRHLRTMLCAAVLAAFAAPAHAQLTIDMTKPSFEPVPVAIVDFAGNADVVGRLHSRFADDIVHSAIVGATHWTEMGAGAGELDGPSPVLFFAPDRIVKRGADWGPARLDQSLAEAWQPFAAWSSNWLRVERISSEDDIKRAYLELLDGKVDPASGCIVEV